MTPPGLKTENGDESGAWLLKLYVAGVTAVTEAARANLERICETCLQGRYSLEVIDLRRQPERAVEHDILAVPTLVRCSPPPTRKVIGDLTLEDRVLRALSIPRPVSSTEDS